MMNKQARRPIDRPISGKKREIVDGLADPETAGRLAARGR
jgi:hypothetical protein